MSPVPTCNKEDPTKSDNTDEVSSVEVPQFVVPGGSDESDDEGEDHGHHGYQLLPQDPTTVDFAEVDTADTVSEPEVSPMDMFDNVVVSSLETHDFINSGGASSMFNVPEGNDELEERCDVWRNQPNKSAEPMDAAHADQIRAAMAGFSLPAPDWAKSISEEQWKAQLISKVQAEKSNSSKT